MNEERAVDGTKQAVPTDTDLDLAERAAANRRHLRFLICLGAVLTCLVIAAGLQSRYHLSIWVANIEYSLAVAIDIGFAAHNYKWSVGHHGR